MKNPWIMIAALIGASAVILGAAGAHIVRGSGGEMRYHDLAVNYQMFHIAALIGVAIIAPVVGRIAHITGGIIVLGLVLFSGSLYKLAWTGEAVGFNVTPTGGILLILGWLMLAYSGWRYGRAKTST